MNTRFHLSKLHKFIAFFSISLLIINFLSACSNTITSTDIFSVQVLVDGETREISVNLPQTVSSILANENISLNPLDKVSPPIGSMIDSSVDITITRVSEEFRIEEIDIPFESQTVKNETLPEGQTLLVQSGSNGKQQVTYRLLYEDGLLVSETIFKTETILEPSHEIVMVGVQTPFTSVPITGRIIYLSSGNAWMMENETGNRIPVITSGDIDGRIFNLSPDQNWLLFTRSSEENDETINTLWTIYLNDGNFTPIALPVENIIHTAEWHPTRDRTFIYSTVEPRSTAPGWQANNDLHILTFTETGGILRNEQIIEANTGGIYGWWGTAFYYSPDGNEIVYSRPDGIGLVNAADGLLDSLIQLTPYQTRSDWAWVPGVAWAYDHSILYYVNHPQSGSASSDESSPDFDMAAIVLSNNQWFTMVEDTGMFAYPVCSPINQGFQFSVAYLQAVSPKQSESSRYNLVVMDQDGSNKQIIFPEDGLPGIDPQVIKWEPVLNSGKIAVLYEGDIWLVDINTHKNYQITGDHAIQKIDWK